MSEQTYLEIAASMLGISPHQLWDYREGLDGISVRTPDGYRHRYRYSELEQALSHTVPPRTPGKPVGFRLRGARPS
jgi:hypothetical protein